MKFSPTDILSQSFSSKLMGYAPEQVDEFLTSLANEWARVTQQLENCEADRRALAQEIKDCRRREHGLHDAMQLAKQVGDDIKKKAEKEAESILEEARQESIRLVQAAETRVKELQQQLLGLQQQRFEFETELRSTLQAHLALLDYPVSQTQEVEECDVIEDRTAHGDSDVIEVCVEGEDDVVLKLDDDIVLKADEDLEPEPASNLNQTVKTAVKRRPSPTAPVKISPTKKPTTKKRKKKGVDVDIDEPLNSSKFSIT